MFTNAEGVTLYTQEDIDQKVLDMGTNAELERKQALTSQNYHLRERALEWFKSEVRGGSMADEDALGIFNGLADALGWDTTESIKTMFTVRVFWNGHLVASFSDIEADDEDSACEEVETNLTVSDPTIEFDIEYNGDSENVQDSISTYDYNPQDDLAFEAVEQ